MSSLYKRSDSAYFWWTARYKGIRLRKSTKTAKKALARKIQEHWDLKLIKDDLDFLGCFNNSDTRFNEFSVHFLELRKRISENAYLIAAGVIRKFKSYLSTLEITKVSEINVKVLDGYVDWLNGKPKTKKNHVGVISLMMDQAVKEDLIKSNPAQHVTLPLIEKTIKHRPLEPIDVEIIFEGAAEWSLYYHFLYYTGLRAGDVALLKYGNIDREKGSIVSEVRKSRRIHEFPLSKDLMDLIPSDQDPERPIFPELYSEDEGKLNNKLARPRKYMQSLLRMNGRPHATLHSFRTTFNNTLRDLGLAIEDRRVLLAHSASETTKIYTHPNFNLASEYVNSIPKPSEKQPENPERDQNVTKNVTKT